MKLLDFIQLARDMRAAQKIKSRLPGDVAKAKDLEKCFDKALEEGVVLYSTISEEPSMTDAEFQARRASLAQLELLEAEDELDGPAE